MDDKEKKRWFVKFPPEDMESPEQVNLIISEYDFLCEPIAIQEYKNFKIVRLTKYSEDDSLDPFSQIFLFCQCVERGIYPPLVLMRKMSKNFGKFLENKGTYTLNEVFEINWKNINGGNQNYERDFDISRAIYILSECLLERVKDRQGKAVEIVQSALSGQDKLSRFRLHKIYRKYRKHFHGKLMPRDLEAFLRQFDRKILKKYQDDFNEEPYWIVDRIS